MSGGNSAGLLRSYIDRVERLREDKRLLAEAESDVFIEAKAAGFDVKVIRDILKDLRKEPNELAEFLAIKNSYLKALGLDEVGL